MTKRPASTRNEGQGAKKPVLRIQTAAVRQRWIPLKPHLSHPAPQIFGPRRASPLGLVSSRTLIPVLIFWLLRNTVLLAPRAKDLMVLRTRGRAFDLYSPERQRFIEVHNQRRQTDEVGKSLGVRNKSTTWTNLEATLDIRSTGRPRYDPGLSGEVPCPRGFWSMPFLVGDSLLSHAHSRFSIPSSIDGSDRPAILAPSVLLAISFAGTL